MHTRKHAKKSAGFTLVELLVVLVILGLLGGLVGPKVMKYLGGAKSDSAKLQIADLSAAMDLYRLEVGNYPSNSEGINALIEAPAGASNWNGPYLRKAKVPKDPWNNDYHYRFPGEHGDFDIYTYGADNSNGGDGENADIGSWE